MMVQNEHWNGQPRPASKLAWWLTVRPMVLVGRKRGRRGFERRQIVEIVVDRLQFPGGRIPQDLVHAAVLRLAGEQAAAHVERDLQVGLHLRQHGEAAGDVEAADHHLDAGLAQRTGDIERARELVRLHADEAHQPEAVVVADTRDDVLGLDPRIGLVHRGDVDLDIGPEHLARRAASAASV